MPYLLQVSATDADAEPYNHVRYDLHVSDLALGDVFKIDRDTGSISTKVMGYIYMNSI